MLTEASPQIRRTIPALAWLRDARVRRYAPGQSLVSLPSRRCGADLTGTPDGLPDTPECFGSLTQTNADQIERIRPVLLMDRVRFGRRKRGQRQAIELDGRCHRHGSFGTQVVATVQHSIQQIKIRVDRDKGDRQNNRDRYTDLEP